MTSKLIDGTEAERIGLVNRVAAADELDAATEHLTAELLACTPLAIGMAKGVIDAAARPALAKTLANEIAIQEICVRSDDFAEGLRAVAEHRPPEFGGR